MNRNQILVNLCTADKFFGETKYQEIVEQAWFQWNNQGTVISIQETLRKLPTNKKLLSQLVEKLHGKSIYKTLKHLNSITNPVIEAKALSSLLTHALISVEQGEVEFKKLLPVLLSKINNKVYEVI